MENPGKLLQRARFEKHLRSSFKPPEIQKNAEGESPAQPIQRTSHASYTVLMRSHDRMRTRHIAGQGGGDGA